MLLAARSVGAQRSLGVQVIARAAKILRALGDSGAPMTLTELAAAAGLPRSTTYRIVVALAAEDFVAWEADIGLVQLGLGLVPLALARRQRLRDAVWPYLEALSHRVGETADLATLRGDVVVFIDQVMAWQILTISAMGVTLPVHCTACGKALLATLPDEEIIRRLPEKLERFTARTITDRAALLEEIAEVRATGVAFDRDEHTEGVSALGAVIQDAWGEVASLTIPVPSQRFRGREEELAQALLQTCRELDEALKKPTS
jgi:DNA-binding IclR family transcriptional regulator